MAPNLYVKLPDRVSMGNGGKMYQIGDYVVCPGHGVGQISDIEERSLGGQSKKFFIIQIVSNGMKVMIPEDKPEGIRDLVDICEIEEVFVLLKEHDVKVDQSTWNRRYRDYMNKIKTGSLLEIADVLRSLFLLKHSKNLSFGEKKMMDLCKDLLIKEISLSAGFKENDVDKKIESCFQ